MKYVLAIDVAKNKSMVSLISDIGEILIEPYEISHALSDFNNLKERIEKFGGKVKNSTPSNIGKNLRSHGRENMGEAVNSIMPQRNMYRNRYRSRM